MEITIRLGEIWTSDTNENGNSLKEIHAEVKPASVTHFGFVTLVSQVSQACCREHVDNNLTLANPAQILPVVFTWKCLKNSCPHISPCPSPLREGLLLSLPYILTDPRRQDWVQLGPCQSFPEDLFNLDMEQNCGAGYTKSMLVFLLAITKRDWEVEFLAQNSGKHKDM